jgi:diadenosine tetraphosphate (Ap4A) HIT family hydrolase
MPTKREKKVPVCGYLAKVDVDSEEFWKYDHPFRNGDTVLILGEIDMMPGHCVLVTKDGRTHFGYHTEDFTPLTEEEI